MAPEEYGALIMKKFCLDFGKYEDYDIDNVPPSYLLWLWEQSWVQLKKPTLYEYLKKHIKEIEKEVKSGY